QSGQDRLEKGKTGMQPDPKVLQFCAPHLSGPTDVLDVGAGFGRSLLAFQQQGHAVYGIERSEHRCRYIRDVLGISCANSAVETAEFRDAFGLIYMNHVLEHVSDPAVVIAELAEKLTSDGMIYIAVPDFWNGEYPPQSFHFVPHLSWFTEKSLQRLLARHGLRV